MPFDRGDVVLVLFPNSDLRTAKKRPALVVQRTRLGTGLSQAVVAMITGNLARDGHPSRARVLRDSSQGREMGLLTDSVVMADNLATVLEDEIDRRIGKCEDMTAVDSALRYTLAL